MTIANAGTKRLTADDLLRLYSEGVRGELIRGVLCETMPTGYEHSKTVANLTILLGSFVKSRKLGSLTASDSGVWLEHDPDTVREPDVAYFSSEKIPLGVRVPGYAEVVWRQLDGRCEGCTKWNCTFECAGPAWWKG